MKQVVLDRAMSKASPIQSLADLPNRIVVYGVTGSGKTTLARKLAELTGLPFHEIDAITFGPNWEVIDLEEQKHRVAAIVNQDRWIIDTMYAKWMDIPLARAQLIIGLDYPRMTSLSRLTRRTISRMVTGDPVCGENRERFRQLLTDNSIIGWHFKSFNNKRTRMRRWENDPAMPPMVRLSSSKEADAWTASLSEKPPL